MGRVLARCMENKAYSVKKEYGNYVSKISTQVSVSNNNKLTLFFFLQCCICEILNKKVRTSNFMQKLRTKYIFCKAILILKKH